MRPTCLPLVSSDTLVGSVARIQKLPSSSLGMNSVPVAASRAAAAATGARAIAIAAQRRRSANSKSGRYVRSTQSRKRLSWPCGSSWPSRWSLLVSTRSAQAARTGVRATESTTAPPMANA